MPLVSKSCHLIKAVQFSTPDALIFWIQGSFLGSEPWALDGPPFWPPMPLSFRPQCPILMALNGRHWALNGHHFWALKTSFPLGSQWPILCALNRSIWALNASMPLGPHWPILWAIKGPPWALADFPFGPSMPLGPSMGFPLGLQCLPSFGPSMTHPIGPPWAPLGPSMGLLVGPQWPPPFGPTYRNQLLESNMFVSYISL